MKINEMAVLIGDYIAMKTTYENELRNLRSWINNVNNELSFGRPAVIDPVSADNTCYQINVVANEIEEEYPFYTTGQSKVLKKDNIPSRCVLWLSCSIQNQHTGRNVILP